MINVIKNLKCTRELVSITTESRYKLYEDLHERGSARGGTKSEEGVAEDNE